MRHMIFLASILALHTTAHAKSDYLEYFDFLTAEAVGELRAQTYDLHLHDNFVGTMPVGGTFLGGGIGIRPIFRFRHGVRFSYEASAAWGRLSSSGRAFDFSTVTRAEFLTGLGWETTLGRVLVLHTTTLIGLDAAWLDAHPRAALDATMPSSAPPPSLSLSRVDLRLGQQVGAHVQLSDWAALYADGTIDYDGQWRARVGIALGRPVR